MRRFVAVDLETTGIDYEKDVAIEVGLAGEEFDGSYFEAEFSLPFDETLMSEGAAKVNGWGKRKFAPLRSQAYLSGFLEMVLRDVHLVGKNPYFDARFLEKILTPVWHHRMVDVGPLAWGWFNANEYTLEKGTGYGPLSQPPNVDDVENVIFDGYRDMKRETVDGFHTALLDARWAYKVFRVIVGTDGQAS